MSAGSIPSVRTVLAWRWGLKTIVRVAAAGLVLWTLATYVPVVVRELFARQFPGLAPFGWMIPSPSESPAVFVIRREFLKELRADGAVVGGAIAMWVLVVPMSRWLVRFPRPLTKCPMCKYSLKGLVTARCPECGLELSGVAEWGADPGLTSVAAPAATSAEHPPARSTTPGTPA